MKTTAKNLDFERAAEIRDLIKNRVSITELPKEAKEAKVRKRMKFSFNKKKDEDRL